MAPKPRPIGRKPSASKDAPPKTQNAQSMPPPPDPLPPQGILVPEVTTLSACLRNAVVKTGQIYGFYADTKRLGINRHAPYPPRSLTASLGREVEKYDQLCDAIESHLLRTIAVLQRDLTREQDRLKAATEPLTETHMAIDLPSAPGSPHQGPLAEALQGVDLTGSGQPRKSLVPLRRSSTISLSSLHRPSFPHKLDLSSTALRFNPDDPLPIPNGLASPVTLAPKSAFPRSSISSDILSAVSQDVDIDLTVPDDGDVAAAMQGVNSLSSGSGMGVGVPGIDSTIGSSADKPIELDLDIDMDLFGDQPHMNVDSSSLIPSDMKQEDNHIDLDILHALQTNDSGSVNEDQKPPNQLLVQSTHSPGNQPSSTGPMLAELQDSSGHGGSGGGFDFDLGFLDNAGVMNMKMEDLFNMDTLPSDTGKNGV